MFVLGNLLIAFGTILDYLLTIINWLIIARAILSWVSPDPFNPIVRFLYATTEPLLAPFRRLIPIWTLGIDFSPVFALVAIWFLKLFLVKSIFGIALKLT